MLGFHIAIAGEERDFVVHDPWRPVPAVGGAYGTPPGPADRSAIDARPDVLTFSSEPALEAMTIAGDVAAELWLTADAPSFDVSCVLSRVAPNGAAMPLAQGYRLVKSEMSLNQAIEIPMRATCATIKRGERLRLSIAGASFPAYPVNPGNGQNPTAASASEARIVTLGVAAWRATAIATPHRRRLSRHQNVGASTLSKCGGVSGGRLSPHECKRSALPR